MLLHAIEAGDVEIITFGEGGFVKALQTGEFVGLKGVGLEHPFEGTTKAGLVEARGLEVLEGVGLSDGGLGEALNEFFACVLVLLGVDENADDEDGRDAPEVGRARVMVGHDDQRAESGDREPGVRDGGDSAEEADDFFGVR